MNKKVTLLRTINLLQRLSQAYYILDISGLRDTEEIGPSKFVENIMLEVQQQILELEQMLSEYSEKPCCLCKGRKIVPDETYPAATYDYMDCQECNK